MKANLIRRHIARDRFCERCSLKAESRLHALVRCRDSAHFWKVAGSFPFKGKPEELDWIMELLEIGETTGTLELERLIMLLWKSWNLQNINIFHNRKDDPHRCW